MKAVARANEYMEMKVVFVLFCFVFRMKKKLACWYTDGNAHVEKENQMVWKRMSNWRPFSNHLNWTALPGLHLSAFQKITLP